MSATSSIKCPNCGTITANSDYCRNCGAIINVQLKRRLEREEKERQKAREEREKPVGKLSGFFQRALEHPNIIIRSLSKGVYSVWMFFGMLIGALIAGFIALASG